MVVLSEPMTITIKEVSKIYQRQKGIRSVNATFKSGVLNIIVGDNGSGKSTLLKCVMGLVSYQGQIIKRRHRIGYAPEHYVMPLRMTVFEFLHSIGRIKGMDKDTLHQNTLDYLAYFDLLEVMHQPIGRLSNGMRQKVNLLQAFVHEPKIIILDEPLAALDKAFIPKMIALIQARMLASLIVISTHMPNQFKTKKKQLFRFVAGHLYAD